MSFHYCKNRRALGTKLFSRSQAGRKRLESVSGIRKRTQKPTTAKITLKCRSYWRKWLRELPKFKLMRFRARPFTKSPLVQQPKLTTIFLGVFTRQGGRAWLASLKRKTSGEGSRNRKARAEMILVGA